MRLTLCIQLALRQLRGQHQQLASFLTVVATAGMILGVALLVVVLSVMNGFERELRDRILQLVPHVDLIFSHPRSEWEAAAQQLSRTPGVLQVTPYLRADGLAVVGEQAEPVRLQGLDADTSGLGRWQVYLQHGQMPGQMSEVVLGSGLAERLGVGLGGSLTVLVPAGNSLSLAGIRPYSLTVTGILHSGTELDQHLLIALRQTLAMIKGTDDNAIDGFQLSLTQLLEARQRSWELGMIGAADYVSHWAREYGNLYYAVGMSRRLVVLLLLAVVAVAVFNVVSALMVMADDKQGDMAILRTLGLTPGQVMTVFSLQGGVIGVVGTLLGLLLGVLLVGALPQLVAALEWLLGGALLSSSVYPVDFLPVDLRLSDLRDIAGLALLVSLLGTLYPAWQASRRPPAELLRYE